VTSITGENVMAPTTMNPRLIRYDLLFFSRIDIIKVKLQIKSLVSITHSIICNNQDQKNET